MIRKEAKIGVVEESDKKWKFGKFLYFGKKSRTSIYEKNGVLYYMWTKKKVSLHRKKERRIRQMSGENRPVSVGLTLEGTTKGHR